MKLTCWFSMFLVAACGPGTRPDSGDPGGLAPDAGSPDSTMATDAPPADAPPACGELMVTLRDFRTDHPDMQRLTGNEVGLVRRDLGLDNKPVYAPNGGTTTVSGATSFNQWYRDVPNINMTFQQPLPLIEGPPGTFTFSDLDFFPLDGMGYGSQGHNHNFHFTTEIHSTFTYHGGELFQFIGDDDVFVFVNKKLALDLGGVHGPMNETIDFDAKATELGIVPGQTYRLDVFHAERHTFESTFRMVTTIDCLVIL